MHDFLHPHLNGILLFYCLRPSKSWVNCTYLIKTSLLQQPFLTNWNLHWPSSFLLSSALLVTAHVTSLCVCLCVLFFSILLIYLCHFCVNRSWEPIFFPLLEPFFCLFVIMQHVLYKSLLWKQLRTQMTSLTLHSWWKTLHQDNTMFW